MAAHSLHPVMTPHTTIIIKYGPAAWLKVNFMTFFDTRIRLSVEVFAGRIHSTGDLIDQSIFGHIPEGNLAIGNWLIR